MAPHSLRYFFAGEEPSGGRVLPLRPPADATPCAAFALDRLASVVDLSHFAPHVYSPQDDAWVSMSPTADALTGRVDVRLHAVAPADAARPAAPLVCDSSALLSATFFGIGIVRGTSVANHGSVWRTALQMGAAFTFTVGASYSRKVEGGADVYKGMRSIPCVAYKDENALHAARVVGAEYVAVEYGGVSLASFEHPRRAVYLLGSEKDGLDPALVARCEHHVSIPVAPGRPSSLNVAAAAAIVLWDRRSKIDARAGDSAQT